MKHLLTLLIAGLAVFSVSAFQFPYIFFEQTDGSKTVIDTQALTMTTADGQFTVRNADESLVQSFPLASFAKFYFSENNGTDGIDGMIADDSPLSVFDTEGRLVGEFNTLSEARENLGSGIYIVKQGDRSVKFIF